MNYQANHINISLVVTLILTWVVSFSAWWFILPALFYFIREVWQFYVLERTQTFDWGGTVPVFISQLLAYLLCVI